MLFQPAENRNRKPKAIKKIHPRPQIKHRLQAPKAILTPFAEGVEKAGFKKGEGEMMSDDGGMSMWTKDKREVSIMLAWDKEKNISSVVVTYR